MKRKRKIFSEMITTFGREHEVSVCDNLWTTAHRTINQAHAEQHTPVTHDDEFDDAVFTAAQVTLHTELNGSRISPAPDFRKQ